MLLKNLQLLLLAIVVSSIFYPILINFLYKYQFGEKVREFGPKTHISKIGTPIMGGIGFFLVTFFLNIFFNNANFEINLLLIVFLISSLFGLIEDLLKVYSRSSLRKNIRIEVYEVFSHNAKTWWVYRMLLVPWNLFREFTRIIGSNASNSGVRLKSHYKFLMHLAVGFFLSYVLYIFLGKDGIQIPFYGFFRMGIFYPLFMCLFFVFTLNAVAITDGLDGLLGGITLIMLVGYWVLASLLGVGYISNFIGIFFGSLLVFLYFNIYPARLFMGDVGSYAIAAALFLIPSLLNLEFLIIVTHALCLFDGGISGIAQQLSVKLTGRRIFRMAPVHHHFEVLGWPETKVTLRFWLLQILLSILGLILFFYL